MVERYKGRTLPILISILLPLLGCGGGGSRKESVRVGKAYLLPELVKKGERVKLVLETISKDGKIDLEVEWRKNGLPIEGVNSSELSSFYFQKGDSIGAHVEVKSSGKVVRTLDLGPAICINSPPVVLKVEISTLDSTTLWAEVECEDADGDPVTVIKNWFLNGNPVHSGETFTTKLLHRGDTVTVEAVPNDGEANGNRVKSTPIVIGNRPPRIVSAPPRIRGDEYTYRIDAEDTDGDELTYSLKKGPEGMKIDSTGLLSWVKGEGVDSIYTVEVEVSDGHGGSAIQKFELKIKENTAE